MRILLNVDYDLMALVCRTTDSFGILNRVAGLQHFNVSFSLLLNAIHELLEHHWGDLGDFSFFNCPSCVAAYDINSDKVYF